MIPCFSSFSLTLCSSMVCFSDIACPLFDLDLGFYFNRTKHKLFALFLPLFSYFLPLLSPGRIESHFYYTFSFFLCERVDKAHQVVILLLHVQEKIARVLNQTRAFFESSLTKEAAEFYNNSKASIKIYGQMRKFLYPDIRNRRRQ